MNTNGHLNGFENTRVLPAYAPRGEAGTIEKTPAKKINGHLKQSTRYLRHLAANRQYPGFERQIAPGAQMSDLDWTAVDHYVAAHGDSLRTTSREQTLVKQGCLAKNETGQFVPTFAGLLLFGPAPEQFIPSAEIIAVHYNGLQPDTGLTPDTGLRPNNGLRPDDPYSRVDLRGSLPQQIRQAEAFVARYLPAGFQLNNLEWAEYPTLPPDAVREVIINAVVHRDYEQGGDNIRLLLFADRLECYSPGPLPGPVTVDNLLVERFSRNEVLARVLSDMGLVERLGHGLNRLVRRLAEEGLPSPCFAETTAGFKVTLFNRPAGLGAGQSSSQPTERWQALGLLPRQIKAMNFAMEHSRINLSDFGRLCPEVSPGALRRDLDDLVKYDLLLRVSEGPVVYYILK